MDLKGMICYSCSKNLNYNLLMEGEVIYLELSYKNIKTLYTCGKCGNQVIAEGWDNSGYDEPINKLEVLK